MAGTAGKPLADDETHQQFGQPREVYQTSLLNDLVKWRWSSRFPAEVRR